MQGTIKQVSFHGASFETFCRFVKTWFLSKYYILYKTNVKRFEIQYQRSWEIELAKTNKWLSLNSIFFVINNVSCNASKI